MLRRTAIAALVSLSPFVNAEPQPTEQVVGRWQGDARLFSARHRAETGELPAELVFEPDGTVSGKIGGATIPTTRPKARTSRRVEYQVVLSGRVHKALNEDLYFLIIILTVKPDAALDADFHLKKRFGLDPAMLVGHFDVRRVL
jgi:hypothetical protein